MIDDEQAFLICQRNGIQLTKGPRLTRQVAEAMLRMEGERDEMKTWGRRALRFIRIMAIFGFSYAIELKEDAPASISQKRESV